MAPQAPTCKESSFDYFVVSDSLRHAVAAIQRIDDAGLSPHWPARLLLRGDARRPLIRTLVRPTSVPGVLPAGPLPSTAAFDSIGLQSHDSPSIDAGLRDWYKLAHSEWESLTGRASYTDQPTFKWQHAAGTPAKQQCGATSSSVAWRSLARRFDEAAILLRKAAAQATSPVGRHGLALARRHLDKACRATTTWKGPDEQKLLMLQWMWAMVSSFWSRNFGGMSVLSQVAILRATSLESKARAAAATAWRSWLGDGRTIDATSNPSKHAYRWIRGLVGWTKSPIGSTALNDAIPSDVANYDDCCKPTDHDERLEEERLQDGRLWRPPSSASANGPNDAPLCAQADVEQEACRWATLWDEQALYECPTQPPQSELLPPIEAHSLLAAAMSFPIGTGTGCEAIAPRAVARLSDKGIRALARLLTLIERNGSWPHLMHLVQIILLPKPDGGRRPIGLFPSIVRIWMRARVGCANSWCAANPRPCIFGGSGMGAQRAAWLMSFRAESAALTRRKFGHTMLDLVKAFEKVPHRMLVAAACKHGYNLWVLQLSLAAYRMPRTVSVGGIFSRSIVATRGITAGSGFATTELRMLLLDVVDAAYGMWPTIQLTLYVDDLSIEAEGDDHEVMVNTTGATDQVVRHLQQELLLEASASKSCILASNPALAETPRRSGRRRLVDAGDLSDHPASARVPSRRRSEGFMRCAGRVSTLASWSGRRAPRPSPTEWRLWACRTRSCCTLGVPLPEPARQAEEARIPTSSYGRSMVPRAPLTLPLTATCCPSCSGPRRGGSVGSLPRFFALPLLLPGVASMEPSALRGRLSMGLWPP